MNFYFSRKERTMGSMTKADISYKVSTSIHVKFANLDSNQCTDEDCETLTCGLRYSRMLNLNTLLVEFNFSKHPARKDLKSEPGFDFE